MLTHQRYVDVEGEEDCTGFNVFSLLNLKSHTLAIIATYVATQKP